MPMTNLSFRKNILVISFLLLSAKSFAPGLNIVYILVSQPIDAFEKLIRAVVQVESGGDTLAFNLTEQAIGAFQIRPIRIRDYNQRTGKNYKLEDCSNFEISKEIFLYYAVRTGLLDYELIARNWNGSGKTTLDYWAKVKKCL